ncbi:hypothetical protein [Leifsonia aquatica]|uniref:hypothetical protein n=1 Tax=Leifsonia aquatica TaxID=144185 RepID=UPI0013B43CBB|nr:hypothetical protein [Leifsonia aquatica]
MRAGRRVRALIGAGLVAGTIAAALTGCAPARERPQVWSPWGPPGFRQPGAPLPFMPSPPPEPPEQAEGDGAPLDGGSEPPTGFGEPDLRLTQTFTLSDGTVATCLLELAVAPDGGLAAGDEPVLRARETLSTTDWLTVIAAPSALPTFAPGEAGTGESEAGQRAQEALGRIATELFARVATGGYSLMGQTSCG